jgi:hypothetical protein
MFTRSYTLTDMHSSQMLISSKKKKNKKCNFSRAPGLPMRVAIDIDYSVNKNNEAS